MPMHYDLSCVRGFPMEPKVILPMVRLVANRSNGNAYATIGLSMVLLAEPVVPLAIPMVPLVEP